MPTRNGDESSSQRFKQTKRYSDAAKAIGVRVRQLRDDAGLTLEEASAQMDIDLKHLQKVESGQLNITLVTILRVADGLGVAPSMSEFQPIGAGRAGRRSSRGGGSRVFPTSRDRVAAITVPPGEQLSDDTHFCPRVASRENVTELLGQRIGRVYSALEAHLATGRSDPSPRPQTRPSLHAVGIERVAPDPNRP